MGCSGSDTKNELGEGQDNAQLIAVQPVPTSGSVKEPQSDSDEQGFIDAPPPLSAPAKPKQWRSPRHAKTEVEFTEDDYDDQADEMDDEDDDEGRIAKRPKTASGKAKKKKTKKKSKVSKKGGVSDLPPIPAFNGRRSPTSKFSSRHIGTARSRTTRNPRGAGKKTTNIKNFLNSSSPTGGKSGSLPPIRSATTLMGKGKKGSLPPLSVSPTKRRKKTNFLNTLDAEELTALGNKELRQLWREYDTDGNGVLDRKEMGRLAKDCINRTLRMFEEELRRTNPDMSEKEIQELIEKERFFLLPGKEKEDSRKAMINMLISRLDVDNDGEITQHELMTRWGIFSTELFEMQKGGAIGCSVM